MGFNEDQVRVMEEVRDVLKHLSPSPRQGLLVEFEGVLALVQKEQVEQQLKNRNYSAFARIIGLPEDSLGKQFLSRGSWYKIEGINLRAPKYPVNARRVRDNKGYRFPAEVVKRGLN